jgi:hypothetical protein
LIKDLNIRLETLQLAQERERNTLEVIDIGKDFISKTQAAQQLRERIDIWEMGLHEIKKILHNKRNGF